MDRLNSLLKKVISQVISRHVRDPNLHSLITITKVETSKDLHHAKVYVGVLGSQGEREKAIEVLQSAAGFISVNASKEVKLRYFPSLRFFLDRSTDKHMHIDHLLHKIEQEREKREEKPPFLEGS